MTIIDRQQRISEPTAATIGMFDGVHTGHKSVLSLLKKEAALRGLATAVITFPTPPQLIIHPEKIYSVLMTLEEKERALEDEDIDYTVVLDFDKAMSQLSAREFINYISGQYGVKLLLIGYDHHFGHDRKDTFADYEAYGKEAGVEIMKSPKLELNGKKVASSIVRELVTDGDVKAAAELMGRRYQFTGTVVDGYHNGSKIGFPTANIRSDDPLKIIPKNGVYAVWVKLEDGSIRQGMLNIGMHPTLGFDGKVSAEANIFDFSGDIYGQHVTVEFASRLRDERKMDSIETLIAQLESDREKAKEILSKQSI